LIAGTVIRSFGTCSRRRLVSSMSAGMAVPCSKMSPPRFAWSSSGNQQYTQGEGQQDFRLSVHFLFSSSWIYGVDRRSVALLQKTTILSDNNYGDPEVVQIAETGSVEPRAFVNVHLIGGYRLIHRIESFSSEYLTIISDKGMTHDVVLL